MQLYIVRHKAVDAKDEINPNNPLSKAIVGLFIASSIKHLFYLLDERANPHVYEFSPISDGGALWFDTIKPEYIDADNERYDSIDDFVPELVDDIDKTVHKHPMISDIYMDERLRDVVQNVYHQHNPNEHLADVENDTNKIRWSTFYDRLRWSTFSSKYW